MQAKKFNSSKAKKTKKITSSKPKFQQKNAAADGYILWSLFGLLLLTYYLFWADFFPNNASALGHDYRYVMPRLLAGYYWFETNGLWAVPYFTPSYCGGDVFFTDPQNNYFSIPQFLTFITNPLAAIKWTVLIFLVIGFSGFYLLLRRIFQLPVAISFFAAALFFLNDYFIYRMIIGHVGYHPFMLLPWVVLALFWQRNGGLKQHLISSTLTAAIFAYVFYGGGVHLLIPMFLMVIILLIIAKLFGVEVGKIYLRLGLFIGMVLLLSGAKLSIALATLANLPRSHLPLDGIHSFFYAIWLPIKALFFAVPTYEYTKNFIGHTIILSRHEFQIGVSIVPLIIIIIGFISKFSAIKNRLLQHKILAIILIGLLLIPIFVNYYTPAWNAFLKQIPIIKNSYSLFRWYSIFIPLVILLAALLLNIWRLNSKQQWLIVIGFLALALAQKFSVNNDYYHQQKQEFYADKIIANQQLINSGKAKIKPISHIINVIQINSKQGQIIADETQMIYGVSKIDCYEPLFGYNREAFPQAQKLQNGKPAKQLKNGKFNFKNPACYTFPQANNCQAGDHFSASQEQQLDNFLHYKPYKFNLPIYQKALNWLTFLSWFWVFALIVWLSKRYFFKP